MKCANCGRTFEQVGHLKNYIIEGKSYCSFKCISSVAKRETPKIDVIKQVEEKLAEIKANKPVTNKPTRKPRRKSKAEQEKINSI